MRNKIASCLAAMVLVSLGVVALTATSASAASCIAPNQVPGVVLTTGSGSVFESGVWVFQVAPLLEYKDPSKSVCSSFSVANVTHTPGTGTIKMRLAIKPSGGSSYNDFTPWVSVPNNSHTTWAKLTSTVPALDYFKVEAQSQLTSGVAAYCSTGGNCIHN